LREGTGKTTAGDQRDYQAGKRFHRISSINDIGPQLSSYGRMLMKITGRADIRWRNSSADKLKELVPLTARFFRKQEDFVN
jgi:hypothetical protein